ncbi:MAG: phosphate ABC transporter ATP-binding protein [Acidobacteriota bacterium]
MVCRDLHVLFGDRRALSGVNITVRHGEILGIIGPANSGKTTFLRTLNRLNERERAFRAHGTVLLKGADIFSQIDAATLRKRVGMIFALPVPLPMTVFDNVAYGPRLHGIASRGALDAIVEKSLRSAFLWDEVKDRLHESAFKLSGGQQQRLCISRTLAVGPEVILYDEPCSGLDPISTARVEESMIELKKDYTIILVTNNVKQAARVSDRTAFFLMGELVELAETGALFTAPSDPRTEQYISGKFG